MGWASTYIAALALGETVSFRPKGNSMVGKISSGELCTVSPLEGDPVKGDIVLCKVKGHQYLHIVKAVNKGLYLIGNNKGGINGWVGRNCIYGILIKIEP